MLRDSVVVVVVVRTRPRAIPLAMITMSKFIDGFPFLFHNSPLWKRVIVWGRGRTASAYGIVWGDAEQNKYGGI